MTSAKITRCKHYFHGVCLRKWLYVQDRCPLCHEIIMNQDPKPNEKEEEVVVEEIAAVAQDVQEVILKKAFSLFEFKIYLFFLGGRSTIVKCKYKWTNGQYKL